jgi:uncharacterized protein (TIGR03083 family)
MMSSMTKEQLLETIRADRAILESTLAPLDEEQLTRTGLYGDWSIKDAVAHLMVWEQRLAGWLEAAREGRTPDRPAEGRSWDEMDQMNHEDYLAHRDRPLQEIFNEFRESYDRLMNTLDAFSEQELMESGYWEWAGDRSLVPMIAANTYEHYQEHAKDIRTWLTADDGS